MHVGNVCNASCFLLSVWGQVISTFGGPRQMLLQQYDTLAKRKQFAADLVALLPPRDDASYLEVALGLAHAFSQHDEQGGFEPSARAPGSLVYCQQHFAMSEILGMTIHLLMCLLLPLLPSIQNFDSL